MIPRPIKLSPETVQTARLAVAGGATVREVADSLGVSYETLRKRSQRGGWLTPQRVAKATEQRVTQRATEVSAASIMERGQSYERHLATAVEKFALKAAAMDPEELLNRAGSLERLDRIGRRTFRLDGEREDKNAVNIAILGSLGSSPTYPDPTMEAQQDF